MKLNPYCGFGLEHKGHFKVYVFSVITLDVSIVESLRTHFLFTCRVKKLIGGGGDC